MDWLPRRALAMVVLLASVLCFSQQAKAQPGELYSQWINYWLDVRGKGNYAEAARAAETMMRLATNQLADDASYLADAQYRLGLTAIDAGALDRAQELLIESLRYYHQQNEFSEDTFWGWHSLATLSEARDNLDDAAEMTLKAIRVAERTNGENSPRVMDQYNRLGFIYRDGGRTDDAIATLERVLEMRREWAGEEDVIEVANDVYNLGMVLNDSGRPLLAEPHLTEALERFRRLRGADNVDVADASRQLGNALQKQGRFDDAGELFSDAIRIYSGAGNEYLGLQGTSLVQLGVCEQRQSNPEGATRTFEAAVRAFEEAFGAESIEMADELDNLGLVQANLARYDDAARSYDEALRIIELQEEVDTESQAFATFNRGWVYAELGRFEQAEAAYMRALELWESIEMGESISAGHVHANLAEVYRSRGQADQAMERARRSIEILEAADATAGELSVGVVALASVLSDQGRFAEAEALHKRNVELVRESFGETGVDYGWACNNLATLYDEQGRFGDAVRYYSLALEVFRVASGEKHPDAASVLHNLSIVYGKQEMYDEAEKLGREAWEVFRATWPETHPYIAQAMSNVGSLRFEREDYAQAEDLWLRSLEVLRTNFGEEHSQVGQVLALLAGLCREQKRFDEGIAYAERAVAIAQGDRTELRLLQPVALFALAELHFDQELIAEAEREVDEVIVAAERLGVSPGLRSEYYYLRARVAWHNEQPQEAVADLRRAIGLAEEQRGMSSGVELERAASFGAYTVLFEQMIQWQLEMGNMTEAFFAFERSRARSLLDELRMMGTNLSLDLSAAERAELDQKALELKEEIVTLEKALRTAKPAEKEELLERLASVRQATYELHRSRRSASPIYQRLLSQDVALPRISQLQRNLIGEGGLILEYLFGEKGGYLLAIDGSGATLHAIEVPAEAAEVFGVAAGPLTMAVCQQVMIGEKQKGVVPQLASAKSAADVGPRLAWLYKILLPAEIRERLSAGEVKRMYLLPDGPLSLLPFEALVDESGFTSRYLLEFGPPMVYGPSATVLDELRRRAEGATAGGDGPVVVSLGDPQYTRPAGGGKAADLAQVDEVSSVRYHAAGGELKPLPFSGVESRWVIEHFEKHRLPFVQLVGADATEQRLRDAAEGCAYLHLACHGQADLTLGNFFGALALAPGDDDFDPADDGFLTLEEIYDLDLAQCELAVLSACQTNFGPQQKGEGVWSLSRGFISAGAQRVLASNWLVDDRAAASLISVFYESICRQRAAGEKVDYAAALQSAKRWVHGQKNWENPYFWSTFVLLGPS